MLVQERGRCCWEVFLPVQLSLSHSLKCLTCSIGCVIQCGNTLCSLGDHKQHPALLIYAGALNSFCSQHHKTRDHLLAVASRAAHLVSCAFMLLTVSFFCYWMVTQVLIWLATLQIVEEINMKLFTLDFNRKTGGIVFQIFLLWNKCILDTLLSYKAFQR